MKNKLGLLRIAAATPKIKVADVNANIDEIVRLCRAIASESNPSVIVFPELCVTGYTCGDLFNQKTLLSGVERGIERLCRETASLPQTIVAGYPAECEGEPVDAVLVIRGGKILDFEGHTFELDGITFAIELGDTLLESGVSSEGTEGADIILCPVASYEIAGRHDKRKAALAAESARLSAAYVYCCSGYGESTDDFAWAGSSLIYANGVKLAENERFLHDSSWICADIDLEALHAPGQGFHADSAGKTEIDPHPFVPADPARLKERCLEIFNIQTVALMSRLEHIHCDKCVIGVSGGLDSTLALLVVCEAFDRLGFDRKGIYAVTMPCFGTSDRTHSNASSLMDALGLTSMEIGIGEAVLQHFRDIGQDPSKHDLTFENAQARERTQVLMDLANKVGGIVIGTGDLSEIALGWCTYNGDHMSMYGVNSGVPKTLVRAMVRQLASNYPCEKTLLDIADTPVSPELVPGQVTEDLVGPYELHDFFLRRFFLNETPHEILDNAVKAFGSSYDKETILKWLRTFIRRFFSQQFKRSCSPCGPKIGSVGLSPQDWHMPTDASASLWLADLD